MIVDVFEWGISFRKIVDSCRTFRHINRMSNFFRTLLQKLFPASDWAKQKHVFIEENQKSIRNLILLVGALLITAIPFFNPEGLSFLAGSILAVYLTVVRSLVWGRAFLAERLEKALDHFIGVNIVNKVLARYVQIKTTIASLAFSFFCSAFQKSPSKKVNYVNNTGASLRSLTLSPSFPRFVLISA